MADILEAAKRAALAAVETSKPAGVYFGTVTSAEPLKISMEQKTELEVSHLILTRNVTDYEVKINEDAVTIYNGLVDGDKVLLLRVQGGQKYVVWDRIT